MGLQVTDWHCENVPERVINLCGMYRLSQFEQCVVLHGKKERTCLLIDIATADDSNNNKQKKLKI
jgi:hypothetical protein